MSLFYLSPVWKAYFALAVGTHALEAMSGARESEEESAPEDEPDAVSDRDWCCAARGDEWRFRYALLDCSAFRDLRWRFPAASRRALVSAMGMDPDRVDPAGWMRCTGTLWPLVLGDPSPRRV